MLLLIRLTMEVLAKLMVSEHRLQACTNQALECGVWCSFYCLKQCSSWLTAFAHELNDFGEDFLPELLERWNKKIYTKLNCVSDEGGKRGRIDRQARIPGISSKQISKRVPVSIAIVENFMRRGRYILVGDKVML